jgi:hypothetical protein
MTAISACSPSTDPTPPGGSTGGSTGDPDGGPADPVDPDAGWDGNVAESCGEYARSDCNYWSQCMPFYLGWIYGSYDACLAQSNAACNVLSTAPGTSWTPPALVTCSKAAAQLSCSDHSSVEECKTQPGTKENGAPCVAGGQCASAYCWRTLDDDCGVCAEKAADGAACSRSANCQSGRCRQRICATVSKEGGPCKSFIDCPTDLACGTNGTCQKPTYAPQGQPCDGDIVQCEGDLSCENGVCDKAMLVDVGQPCGPLPNGKFAFCRGSDCNDANICAPYVPLGATCSSLITCADGGLCTKGICKAYTADACETPGPHALVFDSHDESDARIDRRTRRARRIIGE